VKLNNKIIEVLFLAFVLTIVLGQVGYSQEHEQEKVQQEKTEKKEMNGQMDKMMGNMQKRWRT